MVINKIYPHVNVTTTALIRNAVEAVDTGATTLFVPFLAKKGLANKAQKILNLGQFVAEYGEPDYEFQGRSILNAYNWLNAGGSVYALRLAGSDAVTATGVYGTSSNTLTLTAKHPGTYYSDISVNFRATVYSSSTDYLDVTILVSGNRVAQYFKRSAENLVSTLEASEFFSTATFAGSMNFAALHAAALGAGSTGITVDLDGGTDGSAEFDTLVKQLFDLYNASGTSSSTNVSTMVPGPSTTVSITVGSTSGLRNGVSVKASNGTSFIVGAVSSVTNTTFVITVASKSGSATAVTSWTILEVSKLAVSEEGNSLGYEAIGNKLEFPIDLILDAGFSEITKQAIATFTAESTGDRGDIAVIFDQVEFYSNSIFGAAAEVTTTSVNHAVYTQKLVVNDVLAGKDIYVSPTYFLASLIPVNDRIYGIQWPTAGLNRGVLTGVKSIDVNPTEEQKQAFFEEGINYIEKDSRGFKFMSQRTREDDETALRFLNNIRVVNRMVRDLENLGRDYLFEFNDSATLTNLRNALNRYVNEWIQNRTLSLGTVDVQKNATSDERVDVTLNIRFTGTIEIISIDIVIE
jgi:hypothetical protein